MWLHDQRSCHRYVGYHFIVSTKLGSPTFFETLKNVNIGKCYLKYDNCQQNEKESTY